MKEKWTPGPWVADSTHVRTAINSVATANTQRKHVALVNIAKNPEYEITIEEHEANAHLIAAAPDMYTMLKELQEEFLYGLSYENSEAGKAAECYGVAIELLLGKVRGEV